LKAARPHSTDLLRGHQAGFFQHAKVLDDRRQGHGQWLGQLAYRCRAPDQTFHHVPPTGVGQCVEHLVQLLQTVNHLLKYRLRRQIVKQVLKYPVLRLGGPINALLGICL
jgi:hypothetical protein